MAPVILKTKTKSGNMLSGIDILQGKLILWRKIQKWGSTKNRDFTEFLEAFYLLLFFGCFELKIVLHKYT